MNISIPHEYIKECGQEMPIVVNFPNINPCVSVESVRLQVMHPFQVCNLENCHSNVYLFYLLVLVTYNLPKHTLRNCFQFVINDYIEKYKIYTNE